MYGLDKNSLPMQVKRYFHEGKTGQAPGTFWPLWGGYVTAGHVYTAMLRSKPPFIEGRTQFIAGAIDACLFGCELPDTPPRQPKDGERITIFGYPGGARYMERRFARVYMKRSASGSAGYQEATWIATVDELPVMYKRDWAGAADFEPVFVGMSGGLVMAKDGPIGILVVMNSPTDLDNDGDPDQSCDFVSLHDVWKVYKEPVLVA